MKKIIYLLFTVCLLGCQENTPKNKPVQMPQEDIITESRDSAIVAKPNTVLNTKTDTISKQAKPANPKKIQKPPTKKIPQKIAPPQKQTLGNDLLVGGGKYRYCSSSACLYYSISVTPKNTQIKFHTAYCEGKKILLDGFSSVDGYNRSYTITIGLPWNSGINMGMKGKCEFPDGKAPIPYSGKMLIEYELNGLIKYQNIPATDFKKHLDDKDRGC